MFFQRIKTPGIAHCCVCARRQGRGRGRRSAARRRRVPAARAREQLTIKYVIETHRQEDFVLGSAELARITGAKIVNGRHELFGHGDIRLEDGEDFSFGGFASARSTRRATRRRACVTRFSSRTRRTARGASSPATRCSSARQGAPICPIRRRPAKTPVSSTTQSTRSSSRSATRRCSSRRTARARCAAATSPSATTPRWASSAVQPGLHEDARGLHRRQDRSSASRVRRTSPLMEKLNLEGRHSAREAGEGGAGPPAEEARERDERRPRHRRT